METIIWLIPLSLLLMFIALLGLIWAIRSGQYDDPEGSANRILLDDEHTDKD